MILQFGTLLGGAFGAGGSLGGLLTKGIAAITPFALGVGNQFATGLINRELQRNSQNDLADAIKAQLRAASNAVSPTAAPGQTAVPAGGPATGSAFQPATLLPPSIQPPQRILQTNPNFFPRSSVATFQSTRRPPDLFVGSGFQTQRPEFRGDLVDPRVITDADLLRFPVSQAGLGGVGAAIARGGRAALDFARSFGTTGKRALTGVAIGAAAVEAGAFAAGRFSAFPTEGDPLTIGGAMPGVSTQIPTGLPRTGNFQREANGCQVQWYFWDGSNSPVPIDRGQAECLKRDCIFRLNVFTGKFVKLKGRRMNPMNVRAFFRAGRRVDAGERICRKMFSEHRKTKTGTVRRKRSRKAKR